MDLKQKKTIFWSVVLTIFFIINFLHIWDVGIEKVFQEGIGDGFIRLIIVPLGFLFVPSVLFYRILIGKILVNTDGYVQFFFFFFMYFILFMMFTPSVNNYLINPPSWLYQLSFFIILGYGLNKLLKHFVFKIEDEESENDKKY
jgi:hypothetical protein